MSEPPERRRIVEKWVERAEEDLITAEYVLQMEEHCPFTTVCFHAQQCAEKYLKAYLSLKDLPFPRTHDLLDLYRRLDATAELRVSASELGMLNRYAVESRYPGEWDPITRDDAEEAVRVAKDIRNSLRQSLGCD